MSKASIHFRTRGGPKHGWGNIHRLADFADRCRAMGHDGIRFFAEGPDTVADYLSRRGFEVTALPEDISLDDEAGILSEHEKADVLICEMLDCTPALQSLLRQFTDKLVIFDDLLDHRYDADLVVSAQALPDYGNMEVSAPGTKFLAGYEYFMFSPAYNACHGKQRDHAESVESILVAFGGGCYDGAYIKTARAIAAIPSKPVATFVLGYGADTGLADEIKRELPGATVLGGVDNMAELLSGADLGIVSAGYLKLEAAITGTPAVLVATQWHQIPLAEEFVKRCGAPYVGYMGFVTSESITDAITGLESAEARRELYDRAAGIIDSGGFERVYKAIFGEGA
jgi:spore coat polysaccharide biosynthesis predicted glycosyltransferase SpsG